MAGVLSTSRRSNIEIVYEILLRCSAGGITQTNVKSRVRLTRAQVVLILEPLMANGLIRHEADGFLNLTTPGQSLLKRLTRPMGTIKRVGQLLEKGRNTTADSKAPAEKSPRRVSAESAMLTVSQVARRLSVHPHSVRRWGDAGLLESYRFGVRGDRRFIASDVDAFMRSHKKRVGLAVNLE